MSTATLHEAFTSANRFWVRGRIAFNAMLALANFGAGSQPHDLEFIEGLEPARA